MHARLAVALSMLLLSTQACGEQSNALQNRSTVSTSNIIELALAGRVTDAADLLDANQRSALTEILARLEQRTQHQMIIVTVPSLNGRDVGTFTTELGNRWEIGRKGYDDGIIILVAPNERKARISVGHGLESTLTDAICQSVIDDQMLPAFRDGHFFEGLSAAVHELSARF